MSCPPLFSLPLICLFDISPIICIGENQEEYKNNKTTNTLEKQLAKIIETIQATHISNYITIYIAYEPCWAIGGKESASPEHISTALAYIKKTMQKVLLQISREKNQLFFLNQNRK